MTRSYSIVLDPAPEGGFTVRVPRLPGCVTQGETIDEALVHAREAITAYLLSLRDDGLSFPESDAGSLIVREVVVDVDAA